MEPENRPPSADDRPGNRPHDKKPAPQAGGNFVWYMLGLGVLLLLMIAIFNLGPQQQLRWSDLVYLIEASSEDGPGYIDLPDPLTKEAPVLRISDLANIQVGETYVKATISKQRFKPISGERGGSPLVQAGKKEQNVELRVERLPEEKQLPDLLTRAGLPWTVADPPSALVQYIPLLLMTGLLVMLFIFMIRRMGGAGSPMAFGRSRGKLFAQEDIQITFEDVAGIDEAVEELREVVEFLKTPEKYQMLGGRIPKGVLLVGPPGTGKTLLAKAVAGEAGVPFFSLSGSDFVEMFVGVGAARVRDMFQQAEQKAPCIIFIDELDALGKTRGSGNIGGHDEREQTLNALLVEMDGFNSNSGIIIMGATNRPETLDAALLRPGRFDRHVLVDRPDVAGREEIIEVHLEKIKVDPEVDAKALAAITSGFVGADLANMVNEAALLAARKGKKAVGMEDFNEAVERSSAGLEKKSRIMRDDEKLRVAYHEAGHALVSYSLPNTDPVHKVSIIPRGLAALGYTMYRPEQDRFLITQGELESRIQSLLAGTVAEEMIFSDVSSGAQNDLERATEIARSMVMDYGMSRLGRVNYRESNRSPFLVAGEVSRVQTHSEQTAREIDQEVKRIIDEGLQRTRHILESRRAALVAISEELILQEVIDSAELKRLIEASSPSAMLVPGTEGDTKRRTTPAKPAKDIDASEMERAEG
ncbi:MAG: ATP-dependent zinc metalloprotease FtsH [Pirellulales bacterium]|nr:ATP-dependent zinc metalloprotease FtsH [Pirellulales bacterium]